MKYEAAKQYINEKEQTICGMPFRVEHDKSARRFRIIVEGVMHPAGKLPIRFKTMQRAVSHILNHSTYGRYQPITCAVSK